MAKKIDDMFGSEPEVEASGIALVQTPEFQAALQAELAKMKQDILATLAANKDVNTAGVPAPMVELIQQMAHSIAELTHQGDKHQKPLDPRVVIERAEALARMNALLDDARKAAHEARGKSYVSEEARQAAVCAVAPKYTAIAKLHLGDRIIEPFWRDDATKRAQPTVFYFLDEPNDAMRPANELAEKVFHEFCLSRGGRTDKEKKYAAIKEAWMTDHGLIIEGVAAPARREVAKSAALRDDGLYIPAYKDPEAPFIHVLGTIADPAMQNYQGQRA